jgi:hypothetical protein
LVQGTTSIPLSSGAGMYRYLNQKTISQSNQVNRKGDQNVQGYGLSGKGLGNQYSILYKAGS